MKNEGGNNELRSVLAILDSDKVLDELFSFFSEDVPALHVLLFHLSFLGNLSLLLGKSFLYHFLSDCGQVSILLLLILLPEPHGFCI